MTNAREKAQSMTEAAERMEALRQRILADAKALGRLARKAAAHPELDGAADFLPVALIGMARDAFVTAHGMRRALASMRREYAECGAVEAPDDIVRSTEGIVNDATSIARSMQSPFGILRTGRILAERDAAREDIAQRLSDIRRGLPR